MEIVTIQKALVFPFLFGSMPSPAAITYGACDKPKHQAKGLRHRQSTWC